MRSSAKTATEVEGARAAGGEGEKVGVVSATVVTATGEDGEGGMAAGGGAAAGGGCGVAGAPGPDAPRIKSSQMKTSPPRLGACCIFRLTFEPGGPRIRLRTWAAGGQGCAISRQFAWAV